MFKIITIVELLQILNGYNHKELHVHHTYSPRKSQFNGTNGIALQEAMRDYHVNEKGWSDIGQHVTLLPDGTFVTGRDFGKMPASILGYNEGAFAVEMLGDFDKGEEVLDGPQKESILALARYFNTKGRYVRFHNENADKTCPGSGINKTAFMYGVIHSVTAQPTPPVYPGREYIKQIQELCNENGLLDKYGNKLVVDGIWGEKTASAVPTLTAKCISKYKYFVKLLQRRLLDLGYNLPKFGADGDWGNETTSAFKEFQKNKNLVIDNVCGKLSWYELLR